MRVYQLFCAHRITNLYVCVVMIGWSTLVNTHTDRQLLTGYTNSSAS